MHGCVQREARCSNLKSPRQNGDAHSPESESAKCDSPETSSTASDSPTPTNSVQEKPMSIIELLREFMNDDQCQLLGTEEESSDRHSSDSDHENSDDGLWTITPEQREYYCNQFRILQPDPKGLLSGADARPFFEKSKLPYHQLRKIWHLADVTKDGALSLEEFNTAMHLVVLRRNDIELPDKLPPTLIPNVSSTAPPQNHPPPPPPPPPPPNATTTNAAASMDKSGSEESLASVSSMPGPIALMSRLSETASPTGEREPVPNESKAKWAKFLDSNFTSVSSPGPKPVNFDFHKSAVEQDPKILHPVALRLTPEAQGLSSQMDEAHDTCRSPRRVSTEDAGACYDAPDGSALSATDIRPIQRPQPKKPAAPGPGAIPPPPHPTIFPAADEMPSQAQSGFQQSGPTSLPMGLKKDPPPPPPPRPYRTHTRSSSLDLNKLGKGNLGAPPTVPPRISPNTMSPKMLVGQLSEGDASSQLRFADFTQFETQAECDVAAPRKHGAFEVYRKPTPKTTSNENALENEDECVQGVPSSGDSNRVLRLQEQNAALSRVCQELAFELVELQQERAELQVRLEQVWSSQAPSLQNSSHTKKQTQAQTH